VSAEPTLEAAGAQELAVGVVGHASGGPHVVVDHVVLNVLNADGVAATVGARHGRSRCIGGLASVDHAPDGARVDVEEVGGDVNGCEAVRIGARGAAAPGGGGGGHRVLSRETRTAPDTLHPSGVRVRSTLGISAGCPRHATG
jgi:hypothetical protein